MLPEAGEQENPVTEARWSYPLEECRPRLKQIHDKPPQSKAERKPIDVIVMFKMLVLQQLYNISDNDLEY